MSRVRRLGRTGPEQASQAVQDFHTYLETHKDEIAALQIFYTSRTAGRT
jgi:hypothetical protein